MVTHPQSLKQALKGTIPSRLLPLVRRAYDIIGTIAILEIPPSLEPYEKRIAKKLLSMSPLLTTIVKKVGGHTGRYRRQHLTILAGQVTKTTIHTENGVKLKIHVENTYFSPRLANERARIAHLVQPQEHVLVMFSGVSPYPLTIAKLARPARIVGIEINPKAHQLALENLRLNRKISSIITLYCGDAKKVVPHLHQTFNRIIMPLPKGAKGFLTTALLAARRGTIIHYYDFAPEKDIEACAQDLLSTITSFHKKAKILAITHCGQSGVREYRICIDVQILS